jgi:hypothetical protein
VEVELILDSGGGDFSGRSDIDTNTFVVWFCYGTSRIEDTTMRLQTYRYRYIHTKKVRRKERCIDVSCLIVYMSCEHTICRMVCGIWCMELE